jgi:hypothetical protein
MKLFEARNQDALDKLSANGCLFLRGLLDYPLRPDADMSIFADLCQGQFIRTLTSSEPKLVTPEGDILTLHYDQSAGGGSIEERDKFSTRNPYVFNFTLVTRYEDGSSTRVFAQDILDGKIKLQNSDGSEDRKTLDTLKQIRNAYVTAQRNVDDYISARTAEKERERERLERERAKQERKAAQEAAEEELNNAIDSGDVERIKVALARLEELNPARIRVREIARQAKEGTAEALKSEETLKECAELGITDAESFLCGWLAANVERMFAYIPYTVTKLGRRNNRFLHAFQASFGNCPERASREEAKASGGYALTPYFNDDLDPETAEHRKAGGINQRNIALYVHFRNYAVKKAPRFVQVWLASHKSIDGEVVTPGATIQRNSLVCHLFNDFGFPIAAADDAARNRCKMKANDQEAFTAGFAWPVRLTPTTPPAIEPAHELDQEFPEPEIVTASDYDVEPVAPF